MRVLKPEVAEERKRRLLQWVIHRFIKTAAPVSSKTIAEEGGFSLSPATIRNTLKELEEDGFLFQGHASAGRVPTDKGYRLYVDYLVEMQRLAVEEKSRIEAEYRRRTTELDELLLQTSRMLSSLSHSAGFALSPRLASHPVRRLELVPIGPRHVLVVLLTQSGLIRHWPLEIGTAVTPERLSLLSRFLNEHVQGLRFEEIRQEVGRKLEETEKEFKDLSQVARKVMGKVADFGQPEELFVEGASSLAGLPEADPGALRNLLEVVEDKRRLARILQEEFDDQLRSKKGVQVRIGDENLPELRSVSLVTSTYEVNDRVVGLIGVLGPRHMEYPKMMALVRFVGSLVSHTLARWEEIYGHEQEGKRGR